MNLNVLINGIHAYQGKCPDNVNGPYSRDLEHCELCRILNKIETLKSLELISKLLIEKK